MDRYLCQFRDTDKDYFTTDCSLPTLRQACNYVNRVVALLDEVAEGRVYDALLKCIVSSTDYKPFQEDGDVRTILR